MADRGRRPVGWLEQPEHKDYEAARGYLSMLVAPEPLERLIESLRQAPAASWRAKDILRASRLPLLREKRSAEVAEKLAKIRAGEPLSPILLVVLRPGAVAQIADGYHRVCASYLTHEDTLVPGRIAFLERQARVL